MFAYNVGEELVSALVFVEMWPFADTCYALLVFLCIRAVCANAGTHKELWW